MAEDHAQILGAVLDEAGALSKLVVEQEDHTTRELSLGSDSPAEPDTFYVLTNSGAPQALSGDAVSLLPLLDHVQHAAPWCEVSPAGKPAGSFGLPKGKYILHIAVQGDMANVRGYFQIAGDPASRPAGFPPSWQAGGGADPYGMVYVTIPIVLLEDSYVWPWGWVSTGPISFAELAIVKLK
jgi:hypothetical protein